MNSDNKNLNQRSVSVITNIIKLSYLLFQSRFHVTAKHSHRAINNFLTYCQQMQ